MADLIGQRLGQYEITALLGEGGMATVYRARQMNIKREVAVKVIDSKLARMTSFAKRFEREAETIATLNHSHILKLFDYGEYGDQVYLVMELLQGGTLADRIGRGPLDVERASRILDQMASALDYAHSKGIIHRDLKPQNVLFDETGDAHLSDFGIAKVLNETTALTASGLAMGTPAYMSPEQCQGRALDGRSDIYSLGIMLFEMLAGEVPFKGDTPVSMIYMHLSETPPSITSIRHDLPLSVEKVINKALAKDPIQRFQSAGDLAAAFKMALSGKTPLGVEITPADKDEVDVTAPRPTPLATESVMPSVRRGRRSGLLLIGAIALVAVIGLLAVILSPGGQNANPTATPTTHTQIAAAVTSTQTVLPTLTLLPPSSTATATRTATVMWTTTSSATYTPTPVTPTATPSVTSNLATRAAATIAMRETATANAIASFTHTPTNTPTITLTPTQTPNEEQTLAVIVGATETANVVASYTKTPTATLTNMPTATYTATYTRVPPTATATNTLRPTATYTLLVGKKLIIGFAQIGSESGWRTALTNDMKAEAQKEGIDLKYIDGQQKQEVQIAAMRSFIAQKVDAILLAPIVQTGWDAVFKEAQAVKIPVFLVDRDVTVSDPSLYPVTRVAADFVHEGTVAATWLAQTSNGVCNILELQGVTGSSATIDRTNGFNTAIAKFPKMKIVASMSGDFTRNGGQKAMTALIRSQNDLKGICAIWSHNDDMLLGALVALKAAGIKTGQGGILTVSIDGVTDIFKAMADGDASATVELRPDMGTEAFQAVRDYFAGKPVPKRIVVSSPMWFPDTAAEQYAKRSAGR